jgi:hypothetical protein
MAERSGESANDASDTNNTSRTQRQPKKRQNVANGNEAVNATACKANAREARGGQE